MIPVMLDPAKLRIALIGRDALGVKRLAWLRRLDCEPIVYSDEPSPELAEAAGEGLLLRLPRRDEWRGIDLVWIADLAPQELNELVMAAKAARVIVNVEDDVPYCDFHTPAVVRRGRLMLAVGTGGASPAVAAAVRARLEQLFPEKWDRVLEEIATARAELRAEGKGMSEIAADAISRLAAAGLI